MRNILIFCISLIFLIFNSCIYDSDEIVFRELAPPTELPVISFLNVATNEDTIIIDAMYETDIIIDAGDYKVIRNVVHINGREYSSNDFVMNTDHWPYSNTPYHIELELEIASNNESIADGLGYEVIKGKQTFVIKPIKDLSHIMLKQEAIEGKYKLTWPHIAFDNFDKYIITKTEVGHSRILETIETEDNWLIDKYYIGEISNWNIEMKDLDGRIYKLWRNWNDGYNLSFDKNTSGQYFLKWNKCKYPYNLKKLSVYKSVWANDDQLIYQTSDINDTITQIPGKFGGSGYYYIKAELNNKPQYLNENHVSYAWRGGYVGEEFDEDNLDYIWQINENDMLILRDEHVYKYSTSLNRIVDSLDHEYFNNYSFKLSDDGKRLSYINRDRTKLSVWNTNTFITTPLLENQLPYLLGVRISNTDVCLLESSDNILKLYDLKNNIELDRMTNSSIYGSLISPDGQYAFVKETNYAIYKLQNNKFEKIIDYPTNLYHFMAFDPLNPHILWTYGYGETLEAYDIKENRYVTQIEFKNTVNHIDFYSRKGLGSINGEMLVFNIDTGQILHRIANELGIGYWDKNICIINNTIYSTHGIKYEL